MAISIDWPTGVITVPQADLTFISGVTYQLDMNTFRLALKALEDDSDGMAFPRTHDHTTIKTLGGVTLARTVEIINGYTVTFEPGSYRVDCVGANHNLLDVLNYNAVQVTSSNSAGLVQVSSGSGLSTAQDATLSAIAADTERIIDNLENRLVVIDNGNGTGTMTLYDDAGTTILRTWDTVVEPSGAITTRTPN